MQTRKKCRGGYGIPPYTVAIFIFIAGLLMGCTTEPVVVEALIEPAVAEVVVQVDPTEEVVEIIEYTPVANFPTLHLTLPDHPFHLPRTQRQNGYIAINTQGDNYLTDTLVSVRGRGNTTWHHAPDKRPLRFRFTQPEYLLGSPTPQREWILLANHFDRSLLRNHGALYLANLLDGLTWTPSTQFVHLYINQQYYGVYELTDERDIGPGRLDLIFDQRPAYSDFFLELNGHVQGWRANEFTEGIDYFVVNHKPYEMRWPAPAHTADYGHLAYAQGYLQNVSNAIRTHNWPRITSLIDIDSFIDFYIVQELFMNADIRRFSVFMQIAGQGADRRLFMGPVWDFDQSSGNIQYVENPHARLVERTHYWYNYLFNIPYFREAVVARWDDVKDHQVAQMIDHLQTVAINYREDFDRNFQRHPDIFGDVFEWNWVQSHATAEIDSFMGQAAFLVDFLTQRVAWMDDFLHHRLTEEALAIEPPVDDIRLDSFELDSALETS